MKALRFFFLSILAAFSFAASAQTIEVYKDGRVIDSFSAAQVDSVVYAPAAAQPRYYYYAGWDCPTSVEELEKLIGEKDNGIRFLAGYVTTLEGWNNLKPLVSINSVEYDIDNIDWSKYPDEFHWAILIPKGMNIYDVTLPNTPITQTSFYQDTSFTFSEYNVYRFNSPGFDITGIQIYK